MINYEQLADQDLLELLRSGDRAAYTEIYHHYKFVLHNNAWNKIRNKEEAQDALQEVFSRLWLNRESIDVSTNLAGYLYRSIRNHILNQIARKDIQGRYVASIKAFADKHEVLTDHRVRESQLRELIDREIAALPPRMREVFELSRKKHLTYKEIAEQLGTSEETVKKQLSGALKQLRVKLGILVYLLMLINY